LFVISVLEKCDIYALSVSPLCDAVLCYSEMIAEFLCHATAECNQESLVASVLLARQACLEGQHVFKSYDDWFQVNCASPQLLAAYWLATRKLSMPL